MLDVTKQILNGHILNKDCKINGEPIDSKIILIAEPWEIEAINKLKTINQNIIIDLKRLMQP